MGATCCFQCFVTNVKVQIFQTLFDAKLDPRGPFPAFDDAEEVAIAVGKTNEGESFPANPNFVNPVPLSMTTAGVFILIAIYTKLNLALFRKYFKNVK